MTLSVEHDLLALGVLDTSKEEIASHVLHYSLRGNLLNSTSLGNIVIYNMFFDREGKLIVISDKNITALLKEKAKWSVDLHLVKLIEEMDSSSVAIYGLQNPNKGFMKKDDNILIIENNGKIIETENISEEIIGMDCFDQDLVVYSKRTVYILDSNGSIVFKQKYNKDIDEVYLFEKGHLIVVTKENIYFNKLEKK